MGGLSEARSLRGRGGRSQPRWEDCLRLDRLEAEEEDRSQDGRIV